MAGVESDRSGSEEVSAIAVAADNSSSMRAVDSAVAAFICLTSSRRNNV